MRRMGLFFGLEFRGEGVAGLGLGLVSKLGLGFDFCLDVPEEGEEEEVDLEKNEVIWRC